MTDKTQTQIAKEIFNLHFDDVTRRAIALCDRIVTLGVLDTMILPTGASETHIAVELEALAVAWRADEVSGLGPAADRDTVRLFADANDRPTVRVEAVDDFDRPTRRVPVAVTATRIRRVA